MQAANRSRCSCGTVALMVLGQFSDICGPNIRKLAKGHKGYGSAARADDTGRCHLILPIFGTRLISFTWSIKWKNYLNSLSSKTVTISLHRQQKKIHSCVDSGSVFIIDQFKWQKKEKTRNPYLIFFLDAQFVLL
jgi:hypothetical protein